MVAEATSDVVPRLEAVARGSLKQVLESLDCLAPRLVSNFMPSSLCSDLCVLDCTQNSKLPGDENIRGQEYSCLLIYC